MSVKVVGLGSVAMDVIVQVNALPQVDGFSIARSQVVLDGGSAANVMSQVAKFGVTSGHIAQIGDDDLGKRLLKGLKEFGIDTSRIVVKPEGVSLQTFIPVDPQGEKMIFVNLGNCFLDLSPDQLDPEYISGAKVFYTDLLPPKPAIEGARIAKESGAKVVFNLQMGLSMMEEMGIALAGVGALIKIPSPIGTIGLDSAPGYFSALAFQPVTEGSIVAAIGHLLSAGVVGFPLGIPLHLSVRRGKTTPRCRISVSHAS